jgi:hypothetical protein
MFRLILLSFLLLISATAAWAGCTCSDGTCTPDSNSDDDISLCFSDGGWVSGSIINVPAGDGTVTWNAAIDITDSVHIAGPGKTNLTVSANIGSSWGDNPFNIFNLSGKTIEISGFTTDNVLIDSATIFTNGSGSLTLIIHDMAFTGSGRAIYTRGPHYGVVYDSTFTGVGLLVSEQSDPDTSWAGDIPLGANASKALYFEDCEFTYTSGTDLDCESGGRVVYRYSSLEGSGFGNHGFDSVVRGCLWQSVEHSTIAQAGSHNFMAIQYRGGTGVIHDNTITGTYSGAPIYLQNYRSVEGWVPDTYGYGWCDGNNILDGNTEPEETYRGYPCRDQAGFGVNQTSYPIYEWDNTLNGGNVDFTVRGSGYETTHIVSDRDYFNDTEMPGYTPYTYPHPLRNESETPSVSGITSSGIGQ